MSSFMSRVQEANDDDRKDVELKTAAQIAANYYLDEIKEKLINNLGENNYRENRAGREVTALYCSDIPDEVAGFVARQILNKEFDGLCYFKDELAKQAFSEGVEIAIGIKYSKYENDIEWELLNPLYDNHHIVFIYQGWIPDDCPKTTSAIHKWAKVCVKGRIVVPDHPVNRSTEYDENDRELMDNDQVAMAMDLMSGSEFELFCADLLSQNGYDNVELNGGTGDQGIDILMKKDGVSYGVQIKRYDSHVGNSAVQEAFAGKKYYGCNVGVVMTNSWFTQQAKDLADTNGIVLWDRGKVVDFIRNSTFYFEDTINTYKDKREGPDEQAADSLIRCLMYDNNIPEISTYTNIGRNRVEKVLKNSNFLNGINSVWDKYKSNEIQAFELSQLIDEGNKLLAEFSDTTVFFKQLFSLDVHWRAAKFFGTPQLKRDILEVEDYIFDYMIKIVFDIKSNKLIQALKKDGYNDAVFTEFLSELKKREARICAANQAAKEWAAEQNYRLDNPSKTTVRVKVKRLK